MAGVDLEISFPWCFCGGAREPGEPITVSPSWVESDGHEMWQSWGAHRACLIDAVSDMARWFGGPIFGDDDSESMQGPPPLPEPR
jgi:hypothetical protein